MLLCTFVLFESCTDDSFVFLKRGAGELERVPILVDSLENQGHVRTKHRAGVSECVPILFDSCTDELNVKRVRHPWIPSRRQLH